MEEGNGAGMSIVTNVVQSLCDENRESSARSEDRWMVRGVISHAMPMNHDRGLRRCCMRYNEMKVNSDWKNVELKTEWGITRSHYLG